MIDWDRIEELREEVGAETFDEVTVLFMEETEDTLTRLRQGGSAEAMAECLHFLKGSATTMGFARLAELCRAEEGRLRALPQHRPDLTALTTSYRASCAVFRDGLARVARGVAPGPAL